MKNSNFFTKGLQRKFTMAESVEERMESLNNLRNSIIEFLGVHQVLHNKQCIELHYFVRTEFKDIMDILRISTNDVSKAYRDFRELENRTLSKIFDEKYNVIINEINEDGKFSTIESIVYSRFKEMVHLCYLEGSENIKSKLGKDFSKYIYMLQHISSLAISGISHYLSSFNLKNILVLEMTVDERDRINRVLCSGAVTKDNALGVISALIKVMESEEFQGCKFDTKEARSLKGILDEIIDNEKGY